MSDEEKVWRGKTDEEVLAARRLADYTEEGERAIRAEIQRRGLDESPPTIRHSDPPVESQTSSSHRYRVASALIAFGTTVKVIGAVVAVVIVLAGIASSDSLGSRGLIAGLSDAEKTRMMGIMPS